MANIEMNNKAGGKKNKPQKQMLRVDFTPMVDMNMLLITFFMFCTTLSMPQVMDIAMPAPEGQTKAPESKSITFILDAQDNIYYYEGQANYEDYTALKKTDVMGLRKVLLRRNQDVVKNMNDLTKQYRNKLLSEADYKAQTSEAKKDKNSPIVMIKPTKQSVYKNLVDVLDEMQICGISKYTILDLGKEDDFVLENFKTQGSLTAQIDRSKIK